MTPDRDVQRPEMGGESVGISCAHDIEVPDVRIPGVLREHDVADAVEELAVPPRRQPSPSFHVARCGSFSDRKGA